MENEYTSWPKKRNTGLKISWHYTPTPGQSVQPASKHLENNKYFTQIANVIHENHGIPDDMETFLKNLRTNKLVNESYVGCTADGNSNNSQVNLNLLSKQYNKISMKAIHKNKITEETLEIAAGLYFSVVFCLDYKSWQEGSRTISFYKKPFFHPSFSAESIFKNLARILYLTKETNMLVHYNISKTLFDKAAYMMNLQYADIATYTMGATELEVFKDLDAGRNCCNGKFIWSGPIRNIN